jgi:hypothetical protein
MGIRDGKCDSCGDDVPLLFPIAVLDELPTGGEGMVQKWYCLDCREDMEENYEPAPEKDEDEDKDEEEETFYLIGF